VGGGLRDDDVAVGLLVALLLRVRPLGRGGLGVGCRRLLFGDENVVAFRPTRVAVGRSGVVGRGPVVGPLNDFDVIIGVGPALAAGRFDSSAAASVDSLCAGSADSAASAATDTS